MRGGSPFVFSGKCGSRTDKFFYFCIEGYGTRVSTGIRSGRVGAGRGFENTAILMGRRKAGATTSRTVRWAPAGLERLRSEDAAHGHERQSPELKLKQATLGTRKYVIPRLSSKKSEYEKNRFFSFPCFYGGCGGIRRLFRWNGRRE